MDDQEKSIIFEYQISPNYAAYAVSGGYGGITGHGSIVLSLYHERPAIPKSQEHQLMSDGTLSAKPIKENKKSSLIRDVMFGISLSPPVARSLARWLNEKADMFEKEILQQRSAHESAAGEIH